MKKEIYQFSGINALMGGVFEGFFPIADIKQKGDFGLGCSDGLTGEVIIECCHFLEAKGHKQLRKMADTEQLPFAQITTFTPDKTVNIQNVNKDNLYQQLTNYTLLDNIFLAIKIEGTFNTLKIRRPNDNGKLYTNALEVAANQIIDDLTNIKGTLIGFWTPKFFQNISVAGFHLHFIDTEKTVGGHVIDFSLSKGQLAYEVKSSIHIELSDKDTYLKHDLDIDDMDSIIKKVEN